MRVKCTLLSLLIWCPPTKHLQEVVELEEKFFSMEKLEEPLSAQRAAQAYDKAREVRNDCPPKLEELGKNAALVVREVLVLQICCSAGSLSDVGFESALEQAFGRQLGSELRSQLHLARSAICRIHG